MQRALAAGVALVVAALLAGCGSSTTGDAGSSSTPKDPAFASSGGGATDGSTASEACTLVSGTVLKQRLGLEVGSGRKSLKTADLSVCSYKPSPTSFVLVQSTHSADSFFPASMYPPPGTRSVPVDGADRGYATVVTGSGLMNVNQLLVVKAGRGVQVSVAVKGDYTTSDLVALGRTILTEL